LMSSGSALLAIRAEAGGLLATLDFTR
jgi:hypothetical protein